MKKKSLEKHGYHIERKEEVTIDLVCGMELAQEDAKFEVEYKGKVYYFCSENCQKHFRNDPEKYAS